MSKPQWRDRSMIQSPYFSLCTTKEMFEAEVRRLGWLPDSGWAPPHGARTHHGANEDGESVCLVCVRDWDKHDPISVAAMLVHEAVHIFQEWCRDRGEKQPSPEFEAYSIQWLSQELMHEFVSQTNGGVNA